MKKIAVVVPKLTGFGGMETIIQTVLAHYRQSDSFEIHLLAPFGLGDTEWLSEQKNIKVNARKTLFLPWLWIQLRKEGYQEILAVNGRTIQLLFLIRKWFKLSFRLTSWMHFTLSHFKENAQSGFLKADRHFAISSGIKKQLLEKGVDEKKVQIIYNPVASPTSLVSKGGDDVDFCYIGRIEKHEQKNLQELLEGISFLQGENWRLSIIGDGKDKEALEQYVKEKNLLQHVRFVGWQKEPWHFVSTSSVIVLTSTFEGLPTVLIEAGMHGIPFVSSDCPTGPVDIATKENGFLYPVGNPQELARHLQLFVDKKTTFNTQKIRESVEKFSEENYFKKLEKLLGEK